MLVGVDIGTQSLKVVIVDEDLNPLGTGMRQYSPVYPEPGWAEQDPMLWEQALQPAIADALKTSGGSPRDVSGIGLAGQLDGCIAVARDGLPVAPCLIWVDRRAEEQLQDIPADLVRQLGGVVPDPGHLAAKIRWCKKIFARSRTCGAVPSAGIVCGVAPDRRERDRSQPGIYLYVIQPVGTPL